jgi:predicted AlkP superfamily phosphohydrolase/phosphomutase
MKPTTLLIGLDGATFKILDNLTASGDDHRAIMPCLAELFQKGVRATLKSTPNPLTPPAWVSLMTGRSPGHHGIFDFIRGEELGEDVYFTLYDSRDCRCETIWSIVSRHGKRFAALNFPFTSPPQQGLTGFILPGFVSWRHLRRNTLPKDFYTRLLDLEGFNPKTLAWDFEREQKVTEELTDPERMEWVRYHLLREIQWFTIAKYLLKEEKPDLLAVMFDGVDKLQHQAWPFMNPDLQPGETTAYHRQLRGLCQYYFSNLDGFIEVLIRAAGPNARVFLASDHGFTTTHEIVRINSYLHQKGYLVWKPVSDPAEAQRREKTLFASLDWQKTIAYCRTPSSNGITIRVKDKPGETGIRRKDYEAVRERLIGDLEKLCDPLTGERIITGIFKRETVYPGPAMPEAPDLLLRLRDSGFVSIKNILPVVEPRREMAGTHHPDGVFIAFGPGIKKNKTLNTLDITDVPPVLLHSLGLPVPEDFEGRVPQSLYNPTYLAANPVLQGPATTCRADDAPADKMTPSEKSNVMAQLRMLGYVE